MDPAAATADAGPYVTIPAARLAELEELAAFALKVKARNATELSRVKTHDKSHPEKVAARVKRHKDKDRAAYNARRRELYRLKREAEAAATGATTTPTA
jgi:hypothetical protein